MSQNDRLRLAVIIGSTRRGRFGPVPAAWIADQARQRGGLDVDVVDLAQAPLPTVHSDFGEETPETVRELGARLTRADAFVVVTPEYNHSIPASLKNAVDWYMQEWAAKPVGFVSYGGTAGGIRAVEHLRQVFAEVHAATIRDAISFANFWDKFDGDGQPVDAEGANRAAKGMLDQLAWWAVALRNHRKSQSYVA